MKQMIVLAATVALGVYLFRLIAGEQDDSLLGILQQAWQSELAVRTTGP